MILRRLGSKGRIAGNINKHFPKHLIYIEPFFGAGGMYFNKPKAKYNFLNDIDDDVFNLFMVVKERREELYKTIELMPIHQSLMRFWKKNKETDPIWKAVRFLFISNFTYLAKGHNLKFTADNTKRILLERIEPTFIMLQDAKLMCCDFRSVLKNISFQDQKNLTKKSDCFIYADWPYFGTTGWYTHNNNTENDVTDALDILCSSGIRFGASEFDNEFILDQAKQRNLNVIEIGERRNLKNRRMEILITNYEPVFIDNKQLSLIEKV
jgi:DNA adenine methylase